MTLFEFAPLLVLFIFFVIIFQVSMRRAGKDVYKQAEKFLEEESASNNVRKKEIDPDLFFIPNLDALPIKEFTPDELEKLRVLRSRQEKVIAAAKNKMIKFKEPKTNRDIKFQFGTTNLDVIANYEESYSRYMYSLLNWAESLLEVGWTEDAEKVLYESINEGSELSRSYTLLADIYFGNNNKDKMEELYEIANKTDIPAQKKVWEYINGCLLKM